MRCGFRWLTISQERRARSLFSSADIGLLLSPAFPGGLVNTLINNRKQRKGQKLGKDLAASYMAATTSIHRESESSTLAITPRNTPHQFGVLRKPLDFRRVGLPRRPAKSRPKKNLDMCWQ